MTVSLKTSIRFLALALLALMISAAPLRAEEASSAPEEQAAQTIQEEPQTQTAETEAAQQDTQEDAAKPVDVDLEKMESTGLEYKQLPMSFDRNFWKGSNRSDLIEVLNAAHTALKQPALQRAVFSLLLTKADTDGIQNDIPATPGDDLLTLRMEKLIEGGAYRQAFDLFTKTGTSSYSAPTAQAAILAMLFSGEKSLACLEANSAQQNFKNSDFLRETAAYCDLSLSDAPDAASLETLKNSKDQRLAAFAAKEGKAFSYTPESFGALSRFEQAVLTAEGKIDTGGLTPSVIKNIPATDIQPLLQDQNLSAENRMLLTAQSVAWGLSNPSELAKLYISTMEPAAGSDAKAPDPSSMKEWQKLPAYYYQASNAAQGAEQWDIMRKALALRGTYGIAPLLPYADMMEKTSPSEGTTAEEMLTAYSILAQSGKKIPTSWISYVSKFSTPESYNHDLLALRLANFIAHPQDSENIEIISKFIDLGKKSDAKYVNIAKSFIENVDKGSSNEHNAHKIYEKSLDKAQNIDYVMPSKHVWDRLLEANQDKKTGEAVLLCTVALRGSQLQDVYPKLLHDVLESLNAVGLTKTSEDLAMSAALGI